MEIVKVESIKEMNQSNVYFELEGKFFAKCDICGKPVEIDYHRTKEDLRHDQPGEMDYFCSAEHKEEYTASMVKNIYNMDYAISKRMIAEVLNRDLEKISSEEVVFAIENDTISENVGRNGKKYLWYLDADNKEAVYDLESGKLLTGDAAVKFSEEQFA